MDILPLMDLRGIQPKHRLLFSKDTVRVNSLALTLQVTHRKGLLSQAMEYPQLLKLVMVVNHQLRLDMELDMEHLQHKNLLQIPQFMGKPHSRPALLEPMVSQHLCSQATPILSLHHLVMLSQILLPVPHHLAMAQLRLGMGLHPMVHHPLVSQVTGRRHRLTMHLMVLDMHNLLPTLLMPMQMGTRAGHMMLHLLHRLLSQVELPKLPHKVDVLR